MFLFQPHHINIWRCISTETNTKMANGYYKHNFYRAIFYKCIESETLSVINYWNNGRVTYYLYSD
jgi:hypothetical protein